MSSCLEKQVWEVSHLKRRSLPNQPHCLAGRAQRRLTLSYWWNKVVGSQSNCIHWEGVHDTPGTHKFLCFLINKSWKNCMVGVPIPTSMPTGSHFSFGYFLEQCDPVGADCMFSLAQLWLRPIPSLKPESQNCWHPPQNFSKSLISQSFLFWK